MKRPLSKAQEPFYRYPTVMEAQEQKLVPGIHCWRVRDYGDKAYVCPNPTLLGSGFCEFHQGTFVRGGKINWLSVKVAENQKGRTK